MEKSLVDGGADVGAGDTEVGEGEVEKDFQYHIDYKKEEKFLPKVSLEMLGRSSSPKWVNRLSHQSGDSHSPQEKKQGKEYPCAGASTSEL